ncbi:hypothetical protein CONCODRAFT_166300 [Conidiobolus coronatus NRRL 28638]|uniref:Extracellular membrane protein CFEM domain-containing protein n=1 Tax=Conidiobolus coronatus (strain ATCC 28846 / CBS 209.66 / NRRL 28638) TaxID=796925 RepID=A0A137P0Y1_CONC2|nr:hypothetical protein CONCODRAFT_166300 [Conidiobolus coronatus NRRL 28638]|eukprot:KXN68715.1 hypothetical protein CONCODRAFT_166300 [Conidiobolus coronatus NRRL 28638]
MKFSATLFLLASLVAAHGDEPHGNSTTPATACVTKIDCKLNEEKSDSDAAKKLESCASKTDEAEKTKCIYTALGLKDEQAEKLNKLEKSIAKCAPGAETTSALAPCLGACTGDKKEECIGKCMESVIVEFGKCVKKLAGKPDFDFSKSLECSSKCTQDSLSEVFDCDYDCNKDLYEALITKSGEDSLTGKDSKDGKDDKTKEEGKGKEDAAKDGKSGNSTEKAKGGKSSAMTNFGMSSFGAIAVGTIIFSLLV